MKKLSSHYAECVLAGRDRFMRTLVRPDMPEKLKKQQQETRKRCYDRQEREFFKQDTCDGYVI
jgi:hypothetical protein